MVSAASIRPNKIKAGEYQYAGYEIVRSDPQTWTGKTYWRIFRQGERGVQALRHVGTLALAIREIDLSIRLERPL